MNRFKSRRIWVHGLLAVFFFLSLSSHGLAAETWVHTYGGSESDFLMQCSQRPTVDMSFRGDMWVLKLDSTGSILWQKTYGGKESDLAMYIQQIAGGGYVVAGRNDLFDEGTDMVLLRLGPNGELAGCGPKFEAGTSNTVVTVPTQPFIVVYSYSVQNTAATDTNSTAVVSPTGLKMRWVCGLTNPCSPLLLLSD
jgi:hypothetical protein